MCGPAGGFGSFNDLEALFAKIITTKAIKKIIAPGTKTALAAAIAAGSLPFVIARINKTVPTIAVIKPPNNSIQLKILPMKYITLVAPFIADNIPFIKYFIHSLINIKKFKIKYQNKRLFIDKKIKMNNSIIEKEKL